MNISQVFTVNKSELVEKVGTLAIARVREIAAGITLLVEARDI